MRAEGESSGSTQVGNTCMWSQLQMPVHCSPYLTGGERDLSIVICVESYFYKYEKQLKITRVSRDGRMKSTHTGVSRDSNRQDSPYNLFSSKGFP